MAICKGTSFTITRNYQKMGLDDYRIGFVVPHIVLVLVNRYYRVGVDDCQSNSVLVMPRHGD